MQFDLHQCKGTRRHVRLRSRNQRKGWIMIDTRLKRHAALVDRMATARGIDLEEAAMRAHLAPGDLSDMVLRCAGCAQTDKCAQWLDTQIGAVSATPAYCRNGDQFAELAVSSG
jgi:hypothetical protein